MQGTPSLALGPWAQQQDEAKGIVKWLKMFKVWLLSGFLGRVSTCRECLQANGIGVRTSVLFKLCNGRLTQTQSMHHVARHPPCALRVGARMRWAGLGALPLPGRK